MESSDDEHDRRLNPLCVDGTVQRRTKTGGTTPIAALGFDWLDWLVNFPT